MKKLIFGVLLFSHLSIICMEKLNSTFLLKFTITPETVDQNIDFLNSKLDPNTRYNFDYTEKPRPNCGTCDYNYTSMKENILKRIPEKFTDGTIVIKARKE